MIVSIVVPVYNVAPYITRCLQSIASQTYHNIECILIDDCGSDESIPLAERFINDYKGHCIFSIVHHERNQGLSGARNTGMRTAIGDYVYFLDSDDAITPDCIESLVNLAIRYPNADYIQGDTVKGTDDLMGGLIEPDIPEYCDDKNLLETIILCKTHRTAWNRLIKRSFLLSNSLFFPFGLIMEDHYWTYFVAKKVNAIAICRKETYYYYKNNESIVHSPSKTSLVKRYSSYIAVSEAIINDMLQRNDTQPCHSKYVGEAIVFCMRNLAQLHSLQHWWAFWMFTCRTAYQLRTKITWRRFCLFICMMPPICFMTDIEAWRWRIRHYIIAKI